MFFFWMNKDMPPMHKEEYYNADTIASVAETMAGELPVNSHAAVFSPAAAALLVVDMQRYFLHPDSHAFLPAAPAIIPRINALIDAFAKTGRPVFFTRHGNDKQDGAQMATWWGELLTRDHPLAGLENSMDLAGQPVIEKTQYDAFFNTDLGARLRQWRTSQLVITGIATHLCCESTARSAFTHGFSVFIAIDGTATWNRDLHFASLRGLAHGCAVPFLTNELISAFAAPSC